MLSALVILAVGAFIAIVCLWFAAWDWQGTTTSPQDRRSLHIAAGGATIIAVIAAAATIVFGFRRPK